MPKHFVFMIIFQIKYFIVRTCLIDIVFICMSLSHLSPHNGETATNSAWVKIASRKPWSSTESGYATDSSSKSRGNVSKASSFSGVTLLRNDSHSSTTSSRLSKTGELFTYVV